MRYMARGPIVEAEALQEDPWTGTLLPLPCLALTLALNPLPDPCPHPWPPVEVRWVVDGFNTNRKTNFRAGWGKPSPSSNPNPYPYPFSYANP